MKNKVFTTVMVFIAVLTGYNNLALAQNVDEGSKSNGIVEILALYPADFVAFKPVEGEKFKDCEVWIEFENGKSFKAFKTNALRVSLTMDNGKLESTCTDKSEIRALFNINENLSKPVKIIFIIDGEKMSYNLIDSKWE